MTPRSRSFRACVAASVLLWAGSCAAQSGGTLPVDAAGRSLNLDFETGTLQDWTADGPAFANAVVEGDAVNRRRGDMKSEHQGRFWANSFENCGGDGPHGRLSSASFVATKPWASFLIGAGAHVGTRLELVRDDTKKVFFEARGDETENMKRVVADLSKVQGLAIFIRLVDEDSTGWGHVNFDDFRLHDDKPEVPARPGAMVADRYEHSGLSPVEAARAMTLPPGFKVDLIAGEPDVVQPIALAIDDKGRLWVAEAYSYPHRAKPEDARDRILIFEDKDGDGTFETRKVFADKLNLVSGIEVGFGGVFVGAAPEFLFIPDKDGDDKPDGPPVVLLDGWGLNDTHETLNSFAWGPDGWLYGCHGVFTFSKVGKPGTPDDQRTPINAGIWRYHPKKQRFEVFAHGTSNPWGIDWDATGQMFLTSCVIPHLYQVIPGGRYERQAGSHDNPYTYEDLKTVADHRHYLGATPWSGNGKSDTMGGGHAHSGAFIVQGDNWPAEYRGSILMNNIHGARLNRDTLAPKGSGFVGSHARDFLFANDSWSQVVSLKHGPNGSLFMIDWYDKNQCHRVEAGAHDRTNGRIFRVTYGAPGAGGTAGLLDGVLIPVKDDPWLSRHALRRLHEKGEATKQELEGLATGAFSTFKLPPPIGGSLDSPLPKVPQTYRLGPQARLRSLWSLHAAGGLSAGEVALGFADDSPVIRAWTVRLAVEDGDPSPAVIGKFTELAKSDPAPVVRLALAAALQRIKPEDRWEILGNLVAHAEDAEDMNIPCMVWYAAEPLAAIDPNRAVSLAMTAKLPKVLPFMTRRVAAIGTDQAIAMLVVHLGRAERAEQRSAFLGGLEEALKGRRQVRMPAAWPEVAERLAGDNDEAIRSRATTLGATFGDVASMASLRKVLNDPKSSLPSRQEALAALLKARDPKLVATLRSLVAEASPLRAPAIRGLAAFDDEDTPKTILDAYSLLPATEKRDALNTLASRPDFAKAMLAAVEKKTLPATDLSADLIRQLRNLKDDSVNSRIAEVWGAVREADADKAKLIARYRGVIRAGYTERPDPMLGRAVFNKTCSQCHTLFGAGGKVGPELTGSNRADLEYVLSNVLDPNALIGKDYLAHVIATADGRVLTGIIRSEDKDAITLVTANETLTVPKGDIEARKVSDKSMMPDDIWTPLKDHEVRSLVAYLASPNQVPALATPETAATFFNGKDLSGWQGDTKLWSVQTARSWARPRGLSRNEFLRSDLAAGDFKLTLKVKLVNDEGNSGIQFRSEALPDGEMKGDQADVGPGWWGKLYEENGRGLLWKESGEAHVRKGEWNEYEVSAEGSKVVTKINGHKCVDLDDPLGARRGSSPCNCTPAWRPRCDSRT